jgi:uncharacterized membrane protein HdeD (DUF308 family)
MAAINFRPYSDILPHNGNAQVLCRRTWWVFVLGGLASFAFGVLALLAPGATLRILGLYFAASVLLGGASALLGAYENRDKDGWQLMMLIGVLGVLIGLFALLYPPLGIAAFVYVVALQAIVFGILIVMLGHRVRREISHEWMLYAIGTLSVLLGLLIMVNPVLGSLKVVTLVAVWSIVTGAMTFVFGMNLRTWPAAR